TRLKRYLTERGKIIPRRITGNCAFHQRRLANAVKIARENALIPYIFEG
ncbi:MAG: 30S ribosomal protein S18, partial [Candidatus Melainabacteria bacterium GWF2_37_15]